MFTTHTHNDNPDLPSAVQTFDLIFPEHKPANHKADRQQAGQSKSGKQIRRQLPFIIRVTNHIIHPTP